MAFVLFVPSVVWAGSDEFFYSNIEDVQKLKVEDVVFDDIKFKAVSEFAFNLEVSIKNYSEKEWDCELVIKFYDEDFALIHSNTQNVTLKNVKSDLLVIKQQLDSRYSKYRTSDIKYYSLSISTDEKDFIPSTVGQEIPSETGRYDSYDYLIDKYDIDVTVSDKNVLNIRETIDVHFNVRKHGIYREIPLVNNVKRNDGSSSKIIAKISDIKANSPMNLGYRNGYRIIKIGSSDKLLTGDQQYVINYKYDLGKDKNVGFDELYFNLVGTEWKDTVIGGITFTIKMPEMFDKTKLGFTHGKMGSQDSSYILYAVDGNVISGNYHGILGPMEGLTMRLQLDDGYFKNVSSQFTLYPIFMIIVPLICFVFSIVLWSRYGKDAPVVETVEFYPPQGLNSLELGYIYKGRADNKDAASLLVYLASRGYIKIVETEDQKFIQKNKSFKILKIRDYDGSDANERIFLEGLFASKETYKKSDNFSTNGMNVMLPDGEDCGVVSVTAADLYDNFYRTISRILKNVNSKENKFKYFERSASNKARLVALLLLLTFSTILFVPSFEYGGIECVLQSFLNYISLFCAMLFLVLPLPKIASLFGFCMFAFSSFVSALAMSPWLYAVMNEELYVVALIIGVSCILGVLICYSVMPKRTAVGTELLGKVRGFRRFLETAKKENLEALVMQNPMYFYDILPYTYVLGVSNKWIKKFEAIGLVAPNWYDSPDGFDPMRFESFVNTTMSSVSSSVSSSSSSSEFSGGGSAGGGSGGGGGGSW